ncbi:SDR family oxidoreductase [Pleionea sp. CnH1-48]|uniref:SDR family oxidoreductase n=1 Tax=Pleionea sp. CnH1-48 TaxID=2954494 RepID=UPI00209781B2|nr:SDR family oxidoreductase [Pleionea sp. CnH1-48]MCO7225421.1 SDR family oxidoreductase [Pleionea sp. CnH1-48]
MEVKDKVIWITGASSGIGRAMALHLDKLGAQLILSSRSEADLEAVRQACQSPERHRVVPLDLTQSDTFHELCSELHQSYGHIDWLINNGGISQRSLAVKTSESVIRKVMEVDFFGTVALTQAVLPLMRKQGFGTIINISSIAGKLGAPYRCAYSAAKHALIGFMDSLRVELSRENIRVVVVCPGFVKTNVSVNALTGEGQTFGEMDEDIQQGMNVDEFVKRCFKQIHKGRDEVIVADGLPWLAHHFRRLFPNRFHQFMARKFNKMLAQS